MVKTAEPAEEAEDVIDASYTVDGAGESDMSAPEEVPED